MSEIITIATYNINSIKSRLNLLLAWLVKNPIDILCLQELKNDKDAFPFAALEKIGYECHVFAQKRYNGVAICSRFSLQNIKSGFGSKEYDEQKRIISACYKDLQIVNLYVPHGDFRGEEKYYYKLDFLNFFINYISDHFSTKDRICLAGDFNIAHKDIDIWDPTLLKDTIGTMEEERAAFESLLQLGFVDPFRSLYPQSQKFTWWNYIGGAVWKGQGMRIDYILVTPSLFERVISIDIDMWPRRRKNPTPSDHAPVFIKLKA